MRKLDLEGADTLAEIAKFFRVSTAEVTARGQHLITVLEGKNHIVSRSDYMVLRQFLFPLQPSLKPLNAVSLKRKLLKMHDNEQVVSDFMKSCSSIVVEPITSKTFVWSDSVVSDFYGYLKERVSSQAHTFSNLSNLTGYSKDKLYYLASRFNLKRGMDAEQLDSSVFATLLLFLSRFEVVDDKDLVAKVSKLSPRSVVKVRFVGSFVEKSLVNFVSSKSTDLVFEHQGVSYVALDNALNYLSHEGVKVYKNASRLMGILSQLAVEVEGGQYVPLEVLRSAIMFVPQKVSWSFLESLAVSSGILSEDEFYANFNRYEMVEVLTRLEEKGVISKSLKRHLSSTLTVESKTPQVQLYSPDMLQGVLIQHLFGLPADKVYSDHVSVPLLIEFLEQSDGDFTIPPFVSRVSSSEYSLNGRKSDLVEYISYSVVITHIRNLDAHLYQNFQQWLNARFSAEINQIKETIESVRSDK